MLIIDDHDLFRMGVSALIEKTPGLVVVGEATNARSAFKFVDATPPPAVVLMDLALPGMDGLAATREVRRRCPQTRVIVLSSSTNAHAVRDAFAAGAAGYVAKGDPPGEVLAAIRAVLRDRRHVSPSARRVADGASGGDPLAALSVREREVFDLVVGGLRNRQIAQELCISVKTVGTHRQHINEKLQCSSPAELVRFAADNGVLPPRRPPGLPAA